MKTIGPTVATVLLLITTASLIAWSARSATSDHLVVIIARDMAFYVEGQNEPNPTLTLPTDARVTIELHNADPGMIHDLLVESIDGVHTEALSHGQSDRVTFRTPRKPWQTEYICTFHGLTMRGRLRVE